MIVFRWTRGGRLLVLRRCAREVLGTALGMLSALPSVTTAMRYSQGRLQLGTCDGAPGACTRTSSSDLPSLRLQEVSLA